VGYLVSGRCYDSAPDASTAAFSRVAPSFDGAGLLHTVESTGTGWALRTYDAGVLSAEVSAPSLSLGSCDVGVAVADSALLSFGVIAAWVAAWALVQLRRALV